MYDKRVWKDICLAFFLASVLFYSTLYIRIKNIWEKKSNSSVSCDYFFHGDAWPMLNTTNSSEVVKLCQSVNVQNEIFYASLYNVKTRIPVYSANVVSLNTSSNLPRPGDKYWHRVSLSLCNLKQTKLPSHPILSNVGHTKVLDVCGHFQAEARDYLNVYDEYHLERGHLSPNSINAYDEDKQISTFTLTNAAPQYKLFNEESWRVYECAVKQMIIDLVPNELVYIITGTYSYALDKNGEPFWINENHTDHTNPVLVPGFYWKAVCYPGSKQKKPWAFGIIEENINVKKHTSSSSFQNIQEFSDNYFTKDLFGQVCMNAGFGESKSILDKWESYIHKNCHSPFLNVL